MNKVFEKIIEKLEERTSFLSDCMKYGNKDAEQQNKSYSTMMMYEVADLVDDLIEIVKQEAEKYNNGWIPCSSGVLPKCPNSYYVTKMCETEKLLLNKNSRQKRNKPNTKYIKVLAKNYNEAIQLLKDKGLLYET